jgi:hypothetical protein
MKAYIKNQNALNGDLEFYVDAVEFVFRMGNPTIIFNPIIFKSLLDNLGVFSFIHFFINTLFFNLERKRKLDVIWAFQ